MLRRCASKHIAASGRAQANSHEDQNKQRKKPQRRCERAGKASHGPPSCTPRARAAGPPAASARAWAPAAARPARGRGGEAGRVSAGWQPSARYGCTAAARPNPTPPLSRPHHSRPKPALCPATSRRHAPTATAPATDTPAPAPATDTPAPAADPAAAAAAAPHLRDALRVCAVGQALVHCEVVHSGQVAQDVAQQHLQGMQAGCGCKRVGAGISGWRWVVRGAGVWVWGGRSALPSFGRSGGSAERGLVRWRGARLAHL